MPREIKQRSCLECGAYLDDDNCYRMNNKDRIYKPLSSRCVICDTLRNKEYRNTLRGFMSKLLSCAKRNAQGRRSKGREEAGTFDLTLDQLVDIYNKQNGKCYYSNIPMNANPASNWMCSLERLDNDKGYILDNVALVCLEFNSGTKWSKEKINELLLKLKEEINYDEIMENINDAAVAKQMKRPPRKIFYKTIKGIKHWKCDFCRDYKLMDEYRERESGCKECRALNRKNQLNTIRGHLKILLCRARYHTNDRKKVAARKNNKDIEDVFDLTFDNLIEILKKQRGLCYYSGVKLNYGSYLEKNWVASLERINPYKGYTKDNVCLVCLEFNTADHRSNTKYDNFGSGYWSCEKFKYFCETFYGMSVSKDKDCIDKKIHCEIIDALDTDNKFPLLGKLNKDYKKIIKGNADIQCETLQII